MDRILQDVWNHSIDVWLDDAYDTAPEGTRKLAGIQHLHNNVEAESLSSAVETFGETVFRRAADGLRYFGFPDLDPLFTDLLAHAGDVEYLDAREDQYYRLFPGDAEFEQAILTRMTTSPALFASSYQSSS